MNMMIPRKYCTKTSKSKKTLTLPQKKWLKSFRHFKEEEIQRASKHKIKISHHNKVMQNFKRCNYLSQN